MTGTVQREIAEAYPHHLAVQLGRHPIIRKQRYLPGTLPPLLQHLDGPAPNSLLRVVDLPQVQHLPLNNPAALEASVLDNTPITVALAVLETALGT